MEKIVYSKIKNCLISAQKVRLVADLVRGKSIDDAEGILTFTNKSAAKDILKALKSGIANCVHNEGLDRKDLIIAKIFVDEAQTYKRGRPAARGRYRSVLKRNSHITIGLKNINENIKKVKEEKNEVKKVVKKEEKKEIKKINKKVIKK